VAEPGVEVAQELEPGLDGEPATREFRRRLADARRDSLAFGNGLERNGAPREQTEEVALPWRRS